MNTVTVRTLFVNTGAKAKWAIVYRTKATVLTAADARRYMGGGPRPSKSLAVMSVPPHAKLFVISDGKEFAPGTATASEFPKILTDLAKHHRVVKR